MQEPLVSGRTLRVFPTPLCRFLRDLGPELVQGLLAASRERGVERRVEGMTAWVDAAFLNEAGVPAVCFGPGDTAQAHTEHEWIDVHEIRTCAEVLETFARGLAV